MQLLQCSSSGVFARTKHFLSRKTNRILIGEEAACVQLPSALSCDCAETPQKAALLGDKNGCSGASEDLETPIFLIGGDRGEEHWREGACLAQTHLQVGPKER